MKKHYPKLIVLVLVILHFNISSFAVQLKDTSQVRFVKFSTSLRADFTQISLQEIKALYDGENIALGKLITANNNNFDNNVNAVIDGNESTEWFSDDYISLTDEIGVGPTSNNPHYIVVDLGSTYNLESLKLDLTGGWSFDYTFDFLVSEDATNWSLVDSKYKSHDLYTYTNIPIQNVRYIKYACYYSSDYGQVNVQEIEAFSNGVNVALNKSVNANSYEYGDASSNGRNAVDGNTSSRWSSNRNDYISGPRPSTAPVDVTVDFGEVLSVDSLQLTYNSATTFTLSVSDDGTNWLQIDQKLNDKNKYVYILNRSIKISSAITSFTSTTATCMANIKFDGGSNIVDRGVCWSTTPNPTVLDNKTNNGNGAGSYATTLTELVSNTIYYVRAYAINATETKYSEEQSFLLGLTVQTNVLSNINSIVMSGGYISAINSIEVTERGVCWSTSPLPTIGVDHSSDGMGAGEFSSTLSGLTNATKYYVRAFATTNQGTFYGKTYIYTHKSKQYLASGGIVDGEIFSESGTYNEQPYFSGNQTSDLAYDGYNWYIAGWISSSESGNPPLTGWDYGTELTPLISQNSTVAYNKSSLKESSFNDGSFKNTITITHDNLNGAAFKGLENENYIETEKAIVQNLPIGLTAKIIRNNSLTLTLSITGNAAEHASLNNLSNVKVMLLPDAFTDGNSMLTNGNSTLLSLNFIEPQNITIEGIKDCIDVNIAAENNVILANSSTLNVNLPREMNQLTINPGAKLNLMNTITLNDVILKADDSNSFSAKLGSCMTINGTVTFQKTMIDTKWYLISFPCDINVADIMMIGGGAVGVDFYIQTYSGSNRATNGLGANWSHITNGTLEAKKGYAFGLKTSGGTKTLAFVLNKTIAECEIETSVPTTFHDGSLDNNHKGWNLIGNPYLSQFAGSEVGINYLTIWNGSSYVGQAKNLVGNINPFEAFFVQVSATAPISFSLAGRQAVRSVVSQNLQEGIQLNIMNSGGTDFSTLIFDNKLSSDYEIGQDLEKWLSLSSEKPQIYSQLNGIKYAYNALPIGNVENLPIGYYSKNGGASTISASNVNVPGLAKLLLIDNKTGATTDLMTASYNFNAEAGTNNSRFSINPQRISTNSTKNSENLKPYAFAINSKLIISNLTENTIVRLYDATGKMLHSAATSGKNTYEIMLKTTGMYVVQIDSNTGNWSYKIAAK